MFPSTLSPRRRFCFVFVDSDEDFHNSHLDDIDDYFYSSTYEADYSPGSTLVWAVVAFVFGLAGSISVLVLRGRATADQDGPFRK